jgi:hypothetical protein
MVWRQSTDVQERGEADLFQRGRELNRGLIDALLQVDRIQEDVVMQVLAGVPDVKGEGGVRDMESMEALRKPGSRARLDLLAIATLYRFRPPERNAEWFWTSSLLDAFGGDLAVFPGSRLATQLNELRARAGEVWGTIEGEAEAANQMIADGDERMKSLLRRLPCLRQLMRC